MKASVKVGVEGAEKISKLLNGLGKAIRTELLVPVVREVGKKLEDMMRFNVPIATSALHRSLHTVVVRYPENGVAVAITGPRSRLKFETAEGMRQPSRYAHLVEFGHVAAGPRKLRDKEFIGPKQGFRKFIPPTHPFMRPAIDAMAPISGDMMAKRLWREMEKAAVKGGAKLS